jgi:hypothetical protein
LGEALQRLDSTALYIVMHKPELADVFTTAYKSCEDLYNVLDEVNCDAEECEGIDCRCTQQSDSRPGNYCWFPGCEQIAYDHECADHRRDEDEQQSGSNGAGERDV